MTRLTAFSWALLSFLCVYVVAGRDKECKVPQCTKVYQKAMEEQQIERGMTLEYCEVLLEYGSCLKQTAKGCRGDIIYLSSTAVVRRLLDDFNCSALIPLEKVAPDLPRNRPSIIPALPPNEVPPTPAPPRYCQFQGHDRYRYCGLFGDPHLKTFRNAYQTCRVGGAWPLIDNPYLAVQVTNEPVEDGSPATVTTKVTIIIKGRGTQCTTEKTYEATADQPLPATFVDGTRPSGHNDHVVIIKEDLDMDLQTVEIRLNYIKTTLIVRQVGKHLAFAAQLPEELVLIAANDGNLQLCDTGCLDSERLRLVETHGTKVSWEDALTMCRENSGLTEEIANNLTDHYLDWVER